MFSKRKDSQVDVCTIVVVQGGNEVDEVHVVLARRELPESLLKVREGGHREIIVV